ncbi:MAG: hypothetical protein Q9220_003852 [cf. Caloplaca sp. 1 TL-2023]
MLLLGLTGSLATGKSTVSTLLSKPPYSLPIIDADLLARQVVEPGTRGYKRVIAAFGAEVPDLLLSPSSSSSSSTPTSTLPPNNSQQQSNAQKEGPNKQPRPLNRPALARYIFGSSPSCLAARRRLNAIIHPLVRLAMLRLIAHNFLAGHWCTVLDIPLLFDSGLDIFCPVIVMVAASPETQMRRLRKRNPELSDKEAGERVESQGTVEEKVGWTRGRGGGRGVVVWNDGDRGELEGEVKRVMGEVERRRRGVWRWVFWVVWPFTVVWCGWEVGRGWWGRRRRERERGKGGREKGE